MEKQILILRQIQHLVLIKEEDVSVGAGEKADTLSEKIAKLAAKLEPEAADAYGRLFAKNRIFMSPISKGNCSACGLAVPTSKLQHILGKDRLIVCGNCGRILYAPDVKATGVRPTEPDPRRALSRFSAPELMVPHLKATTREEAIRELAGALAKENVISDPAAIIKASLDREKILTTAVGNGLAFPHMRGVEEGVLTFAAGTSPTGIEWGGEIVHLVFFTVLPVVASPFYLKLLAALTKTFEDGVKLPFVLSAPDAPTLWKELNKSTRVAIKNM